MSQTKNQHWTHHNRNVSYENDVVSYEKETCNSWKKRNEWWVQHGQSNLLKKNATVEKWEMNGEFILDNKIYWL